MYAYVILLLIFLPTHYAKKFRVFKNLSHWLPIAFCAAKISSPVAGCCVDAPTAIWHSVLLCHPSRPLSFLDLPFSLLFTCTSISLRLKLVMSVAIHCILYLGTYYPECLNTLRQLGWAHSILTTWSSCLSCMRISQLCLHLWSLLPTKPNLAPANLMASILTKHRWVSGPRSPLEQTHWTPMFLPQHS